MISKFQKITLLYTFSDNLQIERHLVNCKILFEFHKYFYEIKNYLKTHKEEGNSLRKILSSLNKFYYYARILPLPFSHQLIAEPINSLLAEEEKLFYDLNAFFPQMVNKIFGCIDLAKRIIKSSEAPLYKALEDILSCEPTAKTALILNKLRSPDADRIRNDVLSFFEEKGLNTTNLMLIHTYDILCGINLFDREIVVGGNINLPHYIFDSPRTNRILIVKFKWVKERLPQIEQDGYGWLRKTNKSINMQVDFNYNLEDIETILKEQRLEENEEAEDFAETLNLEENEVQARLVLLESDEFTLCDENAKYFVIDMKDAIEYSDEYTGGVIKKIEPEFFEPGMFVIIPRKTTRDYIEILAKEIMRKQAPDLPEIAEKYQRTWKNSLMEHIHKVYTMDKGKQNFESLEDAFISVSIELLNLGGKKADVHNLKNWISANNIRPRYDEDFEAVLKLLGLENKKNEFFAIAQEIDAAHRKAGMMMRKLLIQKIKSTPISEILNKTKIIFSIEEIKGGREMIAYKIAQISEKKIKIQRNLVNITAPLEILAEF